MCVFGWICVNTYVCLKNKGVKIEGIVAIVKLKLLRRENEKKKRKGSEKKGMDSRKKRKKERKKNAYKKSIKQRHMSYLNKKSLYL